MLINILYKHSYNFSILAWSGGLRTGRCSWLDVSRRWELRGWARPRVPEAYWPSCREFSLERPREGPGGLRKGPGRVKEARGGPGRPQKVQDAEGKVREGPRRPGRLRLSREARGGLSRPGWPSGLRSPGGGRGGRRGRA